MCSARVLFFDHQLWPFVTLLLLLLGLSLNHVETRRISPRKNEFGSSWKCVPITLDFCSGIGYNETIVMSSTVPNDLTKKNSQEESYLELKGYEPLIEKTQCSKNLRLLLCSVYLPFCHANHEKGIVACRPMCEEVKSKCEKHLEAYNYKWPDVLNCDKFSEANVEPNFCVPGNMHSSTKVPPTSKTNKRPQIIPQTVTSTPAVANRATGVISKEKYCQVVYSRNVKNYIYVEKIQSCALECMKDGLFTTQQKQLAERWISALTCICGILSFAAILCVLSNYNETCFPERTIFFIAVCYFFYVVGYMIRIVYSREGVTCQKDNNGQHYLLVDGSGNISCAATFLLVYCFSMVQSIWWVILCLTWFLSAGMRWATDAIRSKSFMFHSLAWGIPCCKTVIVLVWRKIDVNELTGICSIGNRFENLRALRWLILGPLFVYLIMATMFLLFGLICLFRLPDPNENQIMERKKNQYLLLPIGSYAALHTLFMTFILASYFYEYVNKGPWYNDPKSTGPNFAVFLTRIISDFSIGISASIWLLLIHGPRLHRRMKVKLYQTDLLLPRDPAHRIPDHSKHYTSTNETSI